MKTLLSIAAAFGILAGTSAAQDEVIQQKKELMDAQVNVLYAQAGSQDEVNLKKKQLMEAEQKMAYAISNARVVGMEAGIMGPAVKNAPYSADEIHENTQVLADGTRIHNETKTTVYRDSQGRVRRESGGDTSIFDPAAGTTIVMNQSGQVTRKMQMAVNDATRKIVRAGEAVPQNEIHTFQFTSDGPVTFSGPGAGPITIRRNVTAADNAKKETLPTQIIEGVSAEGTRTTNTIDTGAIGNDRPIQVIEERWYSPDLQVNMMTKHTDPRTGEETTRVTNVRRIEPDPSLFTVPANLHQPK